MTPQPQPQPPSKEQQQLPSIAAAVVGPVAGADSIEIALERALLKYQTADVVRLEAQQRESVARDEESNRFALGHLSLQLLLGMEQLLAAGRRHQNTYVANEVARSQNALLATERHTMQRAFDEQRDQLATSMASLVKQEVDSLERRLHQSMSSSSTTSLEAVASRMSREVAVVAAREAQTSVGSWMEQHWELVASKAAAAQASVEPSDVAKRLALEEVAKISSRRLLEWLQSVTSDERNGRAFIEDLEWSVRRQLVDVSRHTILGVLQRDATALEHSHRQRLSASQSPRHASPPSFGVIREGGGTSLSPSHYAAFVQYFHESLRYERSVADKYTETFLAHGFGTALPNEQSSSIWGETTTDAPGYERASSALRAIHAVLREVTVDELIAMGVSTVGERRAMYAKMKALDAALEAGSGRVDSPTQRKQTSVSSRRPEDNDDEGVLPRPPSISAPRESAMEFASPLPRRTLPIHYDAPVMLQADQHQPHTYLQANRGSSEPLPRTALTVDVIDSFRAKCMKRLNELDAHIESTWVQLRHAARKNPRYQIENEMGWETAFRAAAAADVLLVDEWDRMLAQLRSDVANGALSARDLPMPFGAVGRMCARGALLERRAAGQPCPSVVTSLQRSPSLRL